MLQSIYFTIEPPCIGYLPRGPVTIHLEDTIEPVIPLGLIIPLGVNDLDVISLMQTKAWG